MHISIAMATYNGAKYLQEQLDSFLGQTRLPDELVVCDDNSTDESFKILKAFRQHAPFSVKIYCNETNLGCTRNFEKALSLCSGDMLFLSDQDDKWYPSKISVLQNYFFSNPNCDVIINDAHYTDDNLTISGPTVMGKVLSVGGNRRGHIAGACTALSRRFCEFILPFPEKNCPQHDVYVHRWANLLGNKIVVDDILQAWRIHESNATSCNEMARPEAYSMLSRYMRHRRVDTIESYIKKADEFCEMKAMLEVRSESLSRLRENRELESIISIIDQIIDANRNRSLLMDAGWLMRKRIIFEMIVKGQYQHFKGFRSIAKDLLR